MWQSWPPALQPLLSALGALPDGLSDAAYLALATPILTAISGDPLRLLARPSDKDLAPPLRAAALLSRATSQLPMLLEIGSALPLRALAFRLPQLLAAARDARDLPLRKLRLPVDLLWCAANPLHPAPASPFGMARVASRW